MSAPAQISFISGGSQFATVGQPLANPLSVKVVDQNGNPVSGVTVTFTQGTQADKNSGVSFAGGVNTATTNAQGVATSAAMTAWSTPGLVIVQAWAGTPFTTVPIASGTIGISLAGESIPATQVSIQSAWSTFKTHQSQFLTDLAAVISDLSNMEADRDALYQLGAGDVSDWIQQFIQAVRLGYQPRISASGGPPAQIALVQAPNPNVPRDPTAAAQVSISTTTTGQICKLS